MAPPSSPAGLDALLAAWRALPPHERAAVEVLSVLHTPVARSHVLSTLRRLGVTRDAAKKSLDSTRILDALEHIRAAGLLRPEFARGAVYACDPTLARALVDSLCASGRFGEIVAAARALAVPLDDAGELWIALHARDFPRAVALVRACHLHRTYDNPLVPMLRAGIADGALASWPDELVAELMHFALARTALEAQVFDGAYEALERAVQGGRDAPALRLCLAAWRTLRGDAEGADACLAGLTSPRADVLRGWAALARGDVASARQLLTVGKAAPKESPVESLTVLWWMVVLLHAGDFVSARQLLDAARRELPEGWKDALVRPLDTVVRLALGEIAADGWDVKDLRYTYHHTTPLAHLVAYLACAWATPDALSERANELTRLRASLDACGLRWLSSLVAEMIARASAAKPTPEVVLDAMKQTPPWQRALAALEPLLNAALTAPRPSRPRAHAPKVASTRVAWILTLGPVRVDLQPVEQVRKGEDDWSKGRPIALERLERGDPKLPLTDDDRRVIAHIESSTFRHRGYPETTWSIDMAAALDALVGHPAVMVAGDPPAPVEVTRGEPVIELVEGADEVLLRFSPRLHPGFDYAVARDSPMSLRVVKVPPSLQPFATVIGEGIRVPRAHRAAVDRLVPMLSAVATFRSVAAPVAHARGR